jgi:hypothetical protein
MATELFDFDGETDLTIIEDPITHDTDFGTIDASEAKRQQLSIDLRVISGEVEDFAWIGIPYIKFFTQKGLDRGSIETIYRSYISKLDYVQRIDSLNAVITNQTGGGGKLLTVTIGMDGRAFEVSL